MSSPQGKRDERSSQEVLDRVVWDGSSSSPSAYLSRQLDLTANKPSVFGASCGGGEIVGGDRVSGGGGNGGGNGSGEIKPANDEIHPVDPDIELLDKYRVNMPSSPPSGTWPNERKGHSESGTGVFKYVSDPSYWKSPLARKRKLHRKEPQLRQLHSPASLKASLNSSRGIKPSISRRSLEPTTRSLYTPSTSDKNEALLPSSDSDLDLLELEKAEAQIALKKAKSMSGLPTVPVLQNISVGDEIGQAGDETKDLSSTDDDFNEDELREIEYHASKQVLEKNEDSSSDFDLDELAEIEKQLKTKGNRFTEQVSKTVVENEEKISLRTTLNNPNVHRYLITSVQENLSEKILSAINHAETHVTIRLRDCWAFTDVTCKSIINVIGSYDDTDQEVIVDDQNYLLILHPDLLVPVTTVAESFQCSRKVVLNSRIRSCAEYNKNMLYGKILHDAFQDCLVREDFSNDFISKKIELKINEYMQELILSGVTVDESRAELKEMTSKFEWWHDHYFKPSFFNQVPAFGENNVLSIQKVIDIEEEVWSPAYGLKGKIDATVLSKYKNGQYLVPFEIKTSRNTRVQSHRAQACLYTLLLSDRYELDIEFSLLCFSTLSDTVRVPWIRREIQGLISSRNELVKYLQTTKLPPVIGEERMCKICSHGPSCMLYHAAFEKGDEGSSGIPSLFNEVTQRLSKTHLEFFEKWETLISKEESDMLRYLPEIWTMTSKERESVGRSLSNMTIVSVTRQTAIGSSESDFRLVYILQRADGSKLDMLGSQLAKGEPVIVSNDDGHVFMASGMILGITDTQITLSLRGNLSDSRYRRQRGFDHRNMQLYEGALDKDLLNVEMYTGVFRIDLDEFGSGISIARNNLIQVFTDPDAENCLKSVVDSIRPGFTNTNSCADPELDKLNGDQKRAVKAVMTADNYSLILGMPGTGKTTTIASLIKLLVSQGKSVLLTSYTHSAVDNILTKVKGCGFDIIRLGSPSKVHPDVADLIPHHDPTATTTEQMKFKYLAPAVVATTCLGINHWMFRLRRFDYCIVDEASQITLPICLGPLRLADKFVLVGDHYQLSPLVKSAEASTGGLDVSLFKKLSQEHPEAVVNLEHQYRMNRDIMALSNDLVYEGRLKCGDEQVANQALNVPNLEEAIDTMRMPNISPKEDWLRHALLPDNRVVFLNTDSVPAIESNLGGGRIQNDVEAEIVMQCIEGLRYSGVPTSSIGVISVYKSQISVFYDKLGAKRNGLEISTADRFQGRDKDCVIISLVRSNIKKNVGDLLKDWRRLNVSFTRAKSKLVIVGSKSTLEEASAMRIFLDMVSNKHWLYNLPRDCTSYYRVPLRICNQSPLRGNSDRKEREDQIKRKLTQLSPQSTTRQPRKVFGGSRNLAKSRLVFGDV